MANSVIQPRSLFQEKYLNCNSNIIVAGGAMGSSKSYIGLMRHLRWADDPLYRGYCIRRNSRTLMQSGGLFEEATEMYRKYDPNLRVRLRDQRLIFSSGASVTFSHYENDQASELYRGLQLSSAFVDESTDLNERNIWFLISRLRTMADMTPSIWLTCNPTPDHFLRGWVDWWLYPEHHEKFGLPDPDKNGKQRWILRLGDDLHWADTKEELIDKWGRKELPTDHPKQVKPLSITVLLGTIYDNPVLIASNPGYLAALEAQPEVERQRNLLGNWEARESTSTYFDRKWVEEIDYLSESDVVSTVRTFDFAGTLKSDREPSPDYTASVRMRLTKDGEYVVDDVRRTRIRVGDWLDFVRKCAYEDPDGTIYYIPEDPGAAAKRATQMFIRELAENGIYARKIQTNRSKLDRFRPFSSMSQNGGVKFLTGCGTDYENGIDNDNSFVYRELEAFTGQRKRGELGHDDK